MAKENDSVSKDNDAPLISRRKLLVLTGEAAAIGTLAACGASEMTPAQGLCMGAGTGTAITGAEQVAVGEAKILPATEQLYIIARDEKGFMAIKNYCTHSGCGLRISAADKTYICDCHNSIFAFDGALIQGPATRALDHVSMCRRTDGTLVVDKTKTLTGLNDRVT
jgi:cytochrome b6-f complex iron-sulfur subunit